MSEPLPIAVYIHWPYCARICPYCDFNVLRDRGQAEQGALAEAIVRDLEGQAALTGPRRLSSVFLGGGTPSLMRPEWAAAMIGTARRLWPAKGEVEITLEANPTDAEAGRFAAFAEAGVNRLSLGVQAFDDAALKFLGRNHGAEEARGAARTALEVFERLSIDLIYARPGQGEAEWRAELAEGVDIGAEHISPYQLTIEPGTAFGMAAKRGDLIPPDDDHAAMLFEVTQTVLREAGFEAYEVSNHARGEAARSRHNLAYWRGWDYAGAGPGAHGRLTTKGGRLAFEGERRVSDYIKRVAAGGLGFAAPEVLGAHEAALERLLLGLRTAEGAPLCELSPLDLRQDHIDRHLAEGRLQITGGRLIATLAGRAVLDRLTADLIP